MHSTQSDHVPTDVAAFKKAIQAQNLLMKKLPFFIMTALQILVWVVAVQFFGPTRIGRAALGTFDPIFQAQAYYVNANTGNDAYPCTVNYPCLHAVHTITTAVTPTVPTQANGVNIYFSPGRYSENIQLYPDVNLVALEGGWRTVLGTSPSQTITANVAAFQASPDPFPGVLLQNFLIDSSFNWNFGGSGASGYLFLNNCAPSSTTGDTFTGGAGQQCAVITTSGYFEDETLTLNDCSPQTFGTSIFSNVAVTATHDELVLQWLSSPFLGETVSVTTNGQAVSWDSQASPFLSTTFSQTCNAGGTFSYSTSDPFPSSLNFGCSGALYNVGTQDGLWKLSTLVGCTPGELVQGSSNAPFGMVCSNTTVEQAGWTQKTNAITTATGSVTLTSTEYAPPYQTIQSNLTGTLTVVFPNVFSAFWDISTEATTFNSQSIILECGGGAMKTVTTNVLERCYCDGSGNFYCNP
jgi:hypothetical protein